MTRTAPARMARGYPGGGCRSEVDGWCGLIPHHPVRYLMVTRYVTFLLRACTVILTTPLALATMRPALSIVATLAFEDLYLTLTPVAFADLYFPVMSANAPTRRDLGTAAETFVTLAFDFFATTLTVTLAESF